MKPGWANFILKNFWRILGTGIFFVVGILWAWFGLIATVVIICLTLLGFFLGKWLDEGGPLRDFRHWWRCFNEKDF
jgi:uncharacterized membrane protein